MIRSMRLAALAGALLLGGAGAAQAKLDQLTILGGPQGSTWYAIGGGLASMFNKQGVRANSELGGAITNVIKLAKGDAELAFTYTATANMAPKGEAPFPSKIDDIASILLFQDSIVHVLVSKDSGIDAIPDLKGKPFASQAPGNLSQLAFQHLLEVYGMKESDLQLSRGSQTFGGDGVKDRRFVGVTSFSGLPGPMYMEVATSLPVKFLPVPDDAFAKLQQKNSGYRRETIPANTYTGQTEAVPTFATNAIMIVRKSMADDDAYFITKTIGDHLEDFKAMAAANAHLTPAIMANVPGLDLHPGAVRYYKEIGVLK